MGFHITEGTCYLTADLFYLEVVLLPFGGVEDVKVAPHGGSPLVSAVPTVHSVPSLICVLIKIIVFQPSESLLQLLR